jgi:hypothetical protein
LHTATHYYNTKQAVLERLLAIHLSEEKARYLSVLRALLNIGIGYVGLLKHETRWVKQAWCLFYLILLLAILVNILLFYSTGRNVFTINFDMLISPFFYILACLLPRIMQKYI